MRTWDESKHKRDALGRFACQNAVIPEMEKGGLFDGAGSEDVERKPFINIQLFGNKGLEKQGVNQLRKSIKKMKIRLLEHKEKIKRSNELYQEWETLSDTHKNNVIKRWKREIVELNKNIKLAEKLLSKKEK